MTTITLLFLLLFSWNGRISIKVMAIIELASAIKIFLKWCMVAWRFCIMKGKRYFRSGLETLNRNHASAIEINLVTLLDVFWRFFLWWGVSAFIGFSTQERSRNWNNFNHFHRLCWGTLTAMNSFLGPPAARFVTKILPMGRKSLLCTAP